MLTCQPRAPRKTRGARGAVGRIGPAVVGVRRGPQPVDQLVEPLGQGSVAVGCGLLVADRRRRRGVAEAGHHLSHRRPLLGRDRAGGMAQIMEVHLVQAERRPSCSPLALEPAIADDAAGFAGEQRIVRVAADEGGQVGVDGVEHEAGERHRALARIGLGGLSA